jgi:hypothetical protein
VATSYGADLRPLPLAPAHVGSYLARAAAGLDPLTPLLQALPGTAASTALLASPAPGTAATGLPPHTELAATAADSDLPADQSKAWADGWQLLFDGQDPAGCVTVEEDSLDFGCVSRLSPGGVRSFTVHNRTAAKLAAWVEVPGWRDPSAGEQQQAQQVRALVNRRSLQRAEQP